MGKLQYHVLPTLDERQYHFMSQRGSKDDLYILLSRVRRDLRAKNIVITILLNLVVFENAVGSPEPASDQMMLKNNAGASESSTTEGYVQGSIELCTKYSIMEPEVQLILARLLSTRLRRHACHSENENRGSGSPSCVHWYLFGSSTHLLPGAWMDENGSHVLVG
ncbi:hypothetical protein ACJJTC_013414 [Scirpophaga incertulas]